MWDISIMGTDVYHMIHWFFAYSILGWVAESIYISICNKKLTNRGFIHGPICPIYGIGALTVYFILRPLEGNYLVLYVAGMLLATCIEFCTAKLMIRTFGSLWWDYSGKPLNYKGILCLESCLAWGLYTVLMFGFLQRIIVWFVDSYSRESGELLGIILVTAFLLDFVYSLYRIKSNDKSMEALEKRLGGFMKCKDE